MVFVSFIWASSMKSKLIAPKDNSDDSGQIVEIKKNVMDSMEAVQLQGSVYKSMINDSMESLTPPNETDKDKVQEKEELEEIIPYEENSDTDNKGLPVANDIIELPQPEEQ